MQTLKINSLGAFGNLPSRFTLELDWRDGIYSDFFFVFVMGGQIFHSCYRDDILVAGEPETSWIKDRSLPESVEEFSKEMDYGDQRFDLNLEVIPDGVIEIHIVEEILGRHVVVGKFIRNIDSWLFVLGNDELFLGDIQNYLHVLGGEVDEENLQ